MLPPHREKSRSRSDRGEGRLNAPPRAFMFGLRGYGPRDAYDRLFARRFRSCQSSQRAKTAKPTPTAKNGTSSIVSLLIQRADYVEGYREEGNREGRSPYGLERE